MSGDERWSNSGGMCLGENREDLDGENNGGQREQEKESNSRGENKFIEKEGKLREEGETIVEGEWAELLG